MATRSAKLYQGEDMTPVIDYTDQVIWEESEFGARAWQGEGSASTVVIRDPLGEQGNSLNLPSGLTSRSLASKNLFVVDLDGDILFRGRVGIKNYSRDDQLTERYRQVEVSLHDTHWDLDHIFVHNYARPSETGNARTQGVIASYLSGSPRPTTDLNGSNFLSGSNTITLAAQTFTRTTPLQIIKDTALAENKQFFITGDTVGGGSMFYDGNDSTVYQSGIRISDRPDEVDTGGGCATTTAQFRAAGGGGSNDGPAPVIHVTVPTGLTNGALIIMVGKALSGGNWPPDTVTWEPIGETAQGATYVDSVSHATQGGIAIYYVTNPTPGPGAIRHTSTSIGAPVGGWVFENVDQTTPIADYAFATGTGTSASASMTLPADTVAVAAVTVDDDDFSLDSVAAPTTGAGMTEDWATAAQLGTPGYRDQESAGGHGDASPSWTLDESHPWSAFVAAVQGASGTPATFPPIWNVGPASTEDGSEQLCEVVFFYGAGGDQYVTVHNLTVHTQYGHASETFTDDTVVDATEATRRANSILAHRQYEDKTYNVTIGPLSDAQVGCVRHGQTMYIKARAIPDADDQFRLMRIVQCRYTTPVVGVWFAHLQLGRPWKLEPYGTGGGLTPAASGAASGATPEPIGSEGSAGTDNGEVAAADHVHAHGYVVDPPSGDLHDAEDIAIADAGGYFTGTDVEAALQELGAGGGGGGMTNPMTSIGDLIRGGAAGAPTRLAIGGSNTRLASDGSVPLWMPKLDVAAGSNITITRAISGGVETATIAASGGGGGVTREYLGYNTVGASSETMTGTGGGVTYAKKITPANACDLLSIQWYMGGGSGQVTGFEVILFDDNSGAPGRVLAFSGGNSQNQLYPATAGNRWMSKAINYELAASTSYWIAVYSEESGEQTIYYDANASGTDTKNSGAAWVFDWAAYANVSTPGRDYSIRARVIR